jgi:hypothetical protein
MNMTFIITGLNPGTAQAQSLIQILLNFLSCSLALQAGVPGVSGNADGPPGVGLLNAPSAALWEPAREALVVLERGNARVRRMAVGGAGRAGSLSADPRRTQN